MPRKPSGKPTGRPRDERNLQKQHGVRLPEPVEAIIQEMAEQREIAAAEVIRELVAAGLKATR